MQVTKYGWRLDRLLPQWRPRLTRGLTIFTFHEVTDDASAFHRAHGTYLSPMAFAAQIAWIRERFTIIEPGRLSQLGGVGDLPGRAALINFDDSWAGVFRIALPHLRERGVPALCCLNMGTVTGDPDLVAAVAYSGEQPSWPLDAVAGNQLVARLRTRLNDDEGFRAYQGPTAVAGDLEAAVASGNVWFASHLYHHWDIRHIRDDLYRESLELNEQALARLPNHLPAFATPHGYAGEDGRDYSSIPLSMGIRLVLTGTGNQNRGAEGPILDRLSLPTGASMPPSWWYATHRRRVLGSRTS